jgi:small multidrug resistance pump
LDQSQARHTTLSFVKPPKYHAISIDILRFNKSLSFFSEYSYIIVHQLKRYGKLEQIAMKWIYLLIAILGEVIGTTALKASEGFTALMPSIVVVVGYGTAFYFLSLTLNTIPVGISYALWSGIGIVLISAIGWYFFNQNLDLLAIIGIALIVAGVAVINLLSRSTAH